jgi:uncharacterized protein YndB with AHSA1/START domain
MSSGPKHVYEVYIRTTKDKLWQALTDPKITRRFYYDTAVESDWKVGSPITYRSPDQQAVLEGKILAIEPGKKLVTTFVMAMDPEAKKDRPSRVTYEIEQLGDVCKLTLVHDDFDGETHTFKSVGSGWSPVVSSLKTLLETGTPLVIGQPAAAR